MNPRRDKYLTETVLGECWHEWEWWTKPDGYRRKRCSKCGVDVSSGNQRTKMINFSAPEGFFRLWNECKEKEKEWFIKFLQDETFIGTATSLKDNDLYSVMNPIRFKLSIFELIHPDRFADAVYKFLKGMGK